MRYTQIVTQGHANYSQFFFFLSFFSKKKEERKEKIIAKLFIRNTNKIITVIFSTEYYFAIVTFFR